MTHTEDEARKLWCPFARSVWGHAESGVVANRGPTDDGCCCIASQCAVWRWHDNRALKGEPSDAPVRGYCGLAGREG